MKNDYTDKKFRELLDKLQQESWQLELLISGFAIFGLFTSLEPLINGHNRAVALESFTKYLFPVAIISCQVLIINLIIHVVLRGLWIGAIGLRYVSGEIDYDSLNYKKRFTEYLKWKVGSFDKYIGTLENYCSILFAVTFLSLFYIISLFMFLLIVLFGGLFFIESGLFSEMVAFNLLGLFAIFILFLALIIFIDFVTQGYLKKKEWTSFLYFPLYKVFSVITLSFLYRPLVYNFLDNKFGKKLLFILLPVYALTFYLSTVNSVRSNYVNNTSYSSLNFANSNNYLNSLEDNQYIRRAAIQSKVIDRAFLKVFIPFIKDIEDIVINQNLDLKSVEDNRGFSSSLFSSKKRDMSKDSIKSIYLKAFKKAYILKIDDLFIDSDFLITEINGQLGFEAFFPLKNIAEGIHLLKISRLVKSKKTKNIETENVIEIPFWYYKQ